LGAVKKGMFYAICQAQCAYFYQEKRLTLFLERRKKVSAKKVITKRAAAKKPAARKPVARRPRKKASGDVGRFFQTLIDNYAAVLKKYAVIKGRASRKEFWLFFLADLILGFGLGLLAIIPLLAIIIGIASLFFWLATLIPSITVGVRRLHDINKTGWLMLLLLIPLVGWIPLIILCAMKGNSGKNKYGSAP
jgi:uncharacterized membrane protein YhaH (DUF805 family)